MTSNPYDSPEFARQYAISQNDKTANRYEWNVTHPATVQFLDASTSKVLDYGCGAGVFTIGLGANGKRLNPSFAITGTDASTEMLKWADSTTPKPDNVNFKKWDANLEDSELQDGSFDRVFAKLVLNYLSNDHLGQNVLPRLRQTLNDEGLLIAVLPNPLREVGYDNSAYTQTDQIDINVGNFGPGNSAHSYHHTYEGFIKAAGKAGFTLGTVLGLPEVRFEKYQSQLMKIAHPMPMVVETISSAKRWIYVLGATDQAGDQFDAAVSRLKSWRSYEYPEIADKAQILTRAETKDTYLPILDSHRALYEYTDPDDPEGYSELIEGKKVENLSPRGKLRLVKNLAAIGVRQAAPASRFCISL